MPAQCYGDSFTFLNIDDVHTSQEAHVSTVLRRYLYFLNANDVRTSQEAHASTVCCRDSFTKQSAHRRR
jgi:hypothetical protein